MTISIKYMAQIKVAAGVSEEEIELAEPCSAHDLVQNLANKHGDALRAMLLGDSEKLRPTILMFVNQSQVQDGNTVMMKDGDEVMFLSPIAGGSFSFSDRGPE